MRFSRKSATPWFMLIQQAIRLELRAVEDKINTTAQWMEKFRVSAMWGSYHSYRELWVHYSVRRRSLLRQLITLQVRNFNREG